MDLKKYDKLRKKINTKDFEEKYQQIKRARHPIDKDVFV